MSCPGLTQIKVSRNLRNIRCTIHSSGGNWHGLETDTLWRGRAGRAWVNNPGDVRATIRRLCSDVNGNRRGFSINYCNTDRFLDRMRLQRRSKP